MSQQSFHTQYLKNSATGTVAHLDSSYLYRLLINAVNKLLCPHGYEHAASFSFIGLVVLDKKFKLNTFKSGCCQSAEVKSRSDFTKPIIYVIGLGSMTPHTKYQLNQFKNCFTMVPYGIIAAIFEIRLQAASITYLTHYASVRVLKIITI